MAGSSKTEGTHALRKRCPVCGKRRRFYEPPGDQGGSRESRKGWQKVNNVWTCGFCVKENFIRLELWSPCHHPSDAYTAPECRKLYLKGTVTGHPHKEDGSKIRTSGVHIIAGRFITTDSGSLYRLGEAEPEYLKWLQDTYPAKAAEFDPENPIKDKRTHS